MVKILPTYSFNATWNANLNPDQGNFLSHLTRKVKNFVFYLPNSLLAACVNPRKETRYNPFYALHGNYEYGSFRKEIITPDKVHLVANVRIIKGATSETPTVILFNPLGANDSIQFELADELHKRQCNVVTFDYRGRKDTWRAKDLVVDGESVYQYATQELGTQANKVHLYGFSLGGAIAAQVKALHPETEGKFVADRTFTSLFSLITEKCSTEKLGPLVKKITSTISALFLAYPIYLLGWEWDAAKALSKLKGDKRVIYHPNDYLFPFKASLASECPAIQCVRLDPGKTGPETHFAPIDQQNTATGLRAATVVADFLK